MKRGRRDGLTLPEASWVLLRWQPVPFITVEIVGGRVRRTSFVGDVRIHLSAPPLPSIGDLYHLSADIYANKVVERPHEVMGGDIWGRILVYLPHKPTREEMDLIEAWARTNTKPSATAVLGRRALRRATSAARHDYF